MNEKSELNVLNDEQDGGDLRKGGKWGFDVESA